MLKKFIPLFLCLIIAACSEEPALELFSPEAFAFKLENGWEINATVQVKGFKQIEENDEYKLNLKYNVDLITSSSDTLKDFNSGSIILSQKEEFLDSEIEIQANIDSTYKAGEYKLIFKVKDVNSGKSTTCVQPCKIE